MSKKEQPTARKAALSAALKAFRGERARDVIGAITLSPHDRALAMRITTGSLKRHFTLRNIYSAVSRKKHLPENVQEVFRQAVYQMFFMNVEPAVAIDAAVSLAKFKEPHYGAIMNGILHAVSSLKVKKEQGNPDFGELRRSVFVSSDEGGPGHLRFEQRVVRSDPKGDLEHTSSLPAFFGWRYYKALGEEAFWRFADWANSAPRITVRINRNRAGEDAVKIQLPEGAERLSMDGLPEGVFVLPEMRIPEIAGIADGRIIVQDAVNMLAVEAAGIEPGMRVLDMCAAPGGKTAQIADKVGSAGKVIAMEIVPERAETLKGNMERLGVANVEIFVGDANKMGGEMQGIFDVVVLDAPCSNTGQHARRPEVRLRVSQESVARLAGQQKELLQSAVAAAKKGAKIVYSTCSLEPEENGEVVRSAEGVEILEEKLTWPKLHMNDGGYYAVLRRK